MSCFTRGSIALLCVLAVPAFARTHYFSNQSSLKASVSTKILAGRGTEAPLEVRVSVPGIDVTEEKDGFSQVSVIGLEPLGKEGSPALAATGVLIAVPDGFEPEIIVDKETNREISNVTVAPFQKKCRCPEIAQNAFKFNSELYQSQGMFPARPYEIQYVGKLQGLRLARVALHPLQMDLGRRSLKVTTELVLQIRFKATGQSNRVVLPQTLHRLVGRLTANASALSANVVASPNAEGVIIVVADSLKDSIAPLVAWEREKGLLPEVFTFTEAGGSNEKVKTFLQKHYDAAARKPTYLLFVGNKTTLPPFLKGVEFMGQTAASDYPFALLSGDDIIPDMLYGRVLADSAAEVQTQVNRWIAYEKQPDADGTWYKKGTTIASSEGASPSDVDYAEQIQASLKAHTFSSVDKFYQGDESASTQNISDALKEGRSWITYIGHGTGTSWGSSNDEFAVADIGRLDNAGRLPIIVDVACLNADYVNINKPFGKAWVTQTLNGKTTGAVGYLGSSVSTSWHPPAIMAAGIAKQHFEKKIATLGGSVLAGQLALVEKVGVDSSDATDNLTWYNLFGNPSLMVRTDTPKRLVVTQEWASDEEVVVTAKAAGEKPAVGLRVAVRSGDRLVAVEITNASGEATLRLPSVTQGVVTVTGYNAETFQSALDIR